mgnify:CR=1 FL=1
MLVTGVKRDEKSNAILNVDNSSLDAYKASRSRDKQINTYIKDVEILKDDVQEIKQLLKALVDGSKRI